MKLLIEMGADIEEKDEVRRGKEKREKGKREREEMAVWARMPGCVRKGRGVKTERQRGKHDGRAFSLVGTVVAGTAGVSHQDAKISREHHRRFFLRCSMRARRWFSF